MKGTSIVLSAVVLFCSFGAFSVLAQGAQGTKDAGSAQSVPWYSPKKYNPAKLFKRDQKSASDRLASDGNLEIRLTHQLQAQGVLPQDKKLLDACSDFKQLADCVASLRVSSTLKIEFSCLKWDVTGMKPKPVADSCAGPAGGKAMGLYRAVDLLKSDSDARREASEALRRARQDIKDASD